MIGALAAAPSRRQGRVYDVRAFGARGDNVTDDTAAIQAAITAAQNAPGGEVWIGAGRYVIAGTLAITRSVTIRGVDAGPYHAGTRNLAGAQLIQPSGTSATMLTITHPATGAGGWGAATFVGMHVTIENLLLKGAAGWASGKTGHGIHVDADHASGVTPVRLRLQNVAITEANEHGLSINGAIDTSSFRDVFAFSCGKVGVRIVKGTENVSNTPVLSHWHNLRCSQNGQNGSAAQGDRCGLYLDAVDPHTFHGLTLTHNQQAGAELQSGHVVITGCQLESNNLADGTYVALNCGNGGALEALTILGLTCHYADSPTPDGHGIFVSTGVKMFALDSAYFFKDVATGHNDVRIASNVTAHRIGPVYAVTTGGTRRAPRVTRTAVSIASASQTLAYDGETVFFTATAAHAMTSTPTIPSGYEGQRLTLYNKGSNALTLQDEGTLANSNLTLPASTVTIAPGASLELIGLETKRWGVVGSAPAAGAHTHTSRATYTGSVPGTTFVLTAAVPVGAETVVRNGIEQDRVASSPGNNAYTFDGTTIVLGTTLQTGERLWVHTRSA